MQTVTSTPRFRVRALTVALALATSVTGVGALTAGAVAPSDPIAAVVKAGGLGTPTQLAALTKARTAAIPAASLPAVATAQANLPSVSVIPSDRSLSVPATQTSGGVSANAYSTSGSYNFVTGQSPYGTNAGFVVAESAAAPSSYNFTLKSDSSAISLSQTATGIVLVRDSSGKVVNFLNAPWAVDAAHKSLRTRYSVSGGTVTQTIDMTGASFPVVADPALACSGVYCTSEYNKAQTKQIAEQLGNWGGVFVAGCALLNPIAGIACAVSLGVVSTVANNARDERKCLGIQLFIPLLTEYPVIYSGGNCK